MTHAERVEIAKARHADRCKAFWGFWTNGGQEPNDADFGFHHGWYQIDGENIGSHDYAPGPTYNID
jgi:hypothetical protein